MRKRAWYRIICGGAAIGTSRLENADRTMGVAFDAFEPLPEYSAVRAVFRLFAEAGNDGIRLRAYYEARDALDLALEDESGTRFETTVIHIHDFDALKELEIGTGYLEFWKRWDRAG